MKNKVKVDKLEDLACAFSEAMETIRYCKGEWYELETEPTPENMKGAYISIPGRGYIELRTLFKLASKYMAE